MNEILHIMLILSVILISMTVTLTVILLVFEPYLLTKIVLLEVLANTMLASIALWAWYHQEPLFIDICLTLALIMFLGVVAYYQFLYQEEAE